MILRYAKHVLFIKSSQGLYGILHTHTHTHIHTHTNIYIIIIIHNVQYRYPCRNISTTTRIPRPSYTLSLSHCLTLCLFFFFFFFFFSLSLPLHQLNHSNSLLILFSRKKPPCSNPLYATGAKLDRIITDRCARKGRIVSAETYAI